MKKLLSTLALILAISSVSIANTSRKKNTHHKKVAVKVTYYCDDAGHIIGGVGSGGTIWGSGSSSGCEC